MPGDVDTWLAGPPAVIMPGDTCAIEIKCGMIAFAIPLHRPSNCFAASGLGGGPNSALTIAYMDFAKTASVPVNAI